MIFDDILMPMRRKFPLVIVLLFSSIFLPGCVLKKTPAAIQISSNPTANVFIDSKSLGKTPYYGNNFNSGEVTLKLIPESSETVLLPWETKIKLNAGVLTLVERNFASSEGESSGQILSLEKLQDSKATAISIISDPDGSLVKFDGELKGFSPLALDQISLGDHEISISKEGYSEKRVKAKTVAGYRLIINVKLSQVVSPSPTTTTVTPTSVPQKTTPIPKTTETTTGEKKEINLVIKETPTGWLRVRSLPSTGTDSSEVAKVNPGEKYLLLEEKPGWYKIEYEKGKFGWISSTYAQKQ